MYAALEKGANLDSKLGVKWDDAVEVRRWVKERVEDVLGKKVDGEGDLFQQGMDRFVSVYLISSLIACAN